MPIVKVPRAGVIDHATTNKVRSLRRVRQAFAMALLLGADQPKPRYEFVDERWRVRETHGGMCRVWFAWQDGDSIDFRIADNPDIAE